MNELIPACCICSSEADWVRMRMPNGQQMDYLCQRHFESLKERNPILAAHYDEIVSGRRTEPRRSHYSTENTPGSAEQYGRSRPA